MTSSFSWLDYSEHERRKVLDVIRLFSEKDTRDELGIGAIRDAFADLLFPGTSTIQTRAKYFLLVPWIYHSLERRRAKSPEIADRARREELALIGHLTRSDDSTGTIGVNARDTLQRLPSNIYWIGLETWGIRHFAGSQPQYHRSLDAFYSVSDRNRRNDDGEPIFGAVPYNWHPGLPPIPKDFPKGLSMRLSRTEAEYLRERIMTHVPGTLLAFLVDRGQLCGPVEFPWQHPQVVEFPHHCQDQLGHGRSFSEVINGAALLYNLILSELAERQQLVADYQRLLEEWSQLVEQRRRVLVQWKRKRFWGIVESGGARITLPTRRFVDSWLDIALSANITSIVSNKDARNLICDRERRLKGKESRLENRRALENWSGAAGIGRLSYRWPMTQRITLDILTGLKQEDAGA